MFFSATAERRSLVGINDLCGPHASVGLQSADIHCVFGIVCWADTWEKLTWIIHESEQTHTACVCVKYARNRTNIPRVCCVIYPAYDRRRTRHLLRMSPEHTQHLSSLFVTHVQVQAVCSSDRCRLFSAPLYFTPDIHAKYRDFPRIICILPSAAIATRSFTICPFTLIFISW